VSLLHIRHRTVLLAKRQTREIFGLAYSGNGRIAKVLVSAEFGNPL
jgi:hypothetical protein